jgi:peptidoglycan glycosyltransferase
MFKKILLFLICMVQIHTAHPVIGSQNTKHKKTVAQETKKKSTKKKRRISSSSSSKKELAPISLKKVYIKSLENTEKKDQISAFSDPRQFLDNQSVSIQTPFGQISWPDIAAKVYTVNNKAFAYYKGYKLLLTIDPSLQESSGKYLNQSRIIHGATAIIEPHTGRILSLAQSGGSRNAIVSVASRAPAASLIKIVTASAGIEKGDLKPQDEIAFRGGCSVLRNENWIRDPSRDTQILTLSKAFGRSCNTVFARVAIYNSGLVALKTYAEKFMFNKPIPSDIHLQTSMFLLPDIETASSLEVAEAGAGFGATKISPVHAALLSATVKNNGIMMAPYLVEEAYDSQDRLVYKASPKQIGRVITKETAAEIEELMHATIVSGTSRRAFSKKGTRADIDEIGGKTGTLLDPEDRDMLYTWFSGIAPMNSDKGIAIGTVVASAQNWVVRASGIAQTTLADYFRLEHKESL